jgi:phosphoribosylformylglycinamidine synthase
MDALLFGESAGRIVVSCEPSAVALLLALAKRRAVPATVIGQVGGSQLSIGSWIEAPVEALNDAWRGGLQEALLYG